MDSTDFSNEATKRTVDACKSQIKASERRTMIQIQIFGLMTVMLLFFIYYLLHVRIKMIQGFLDAALEGNVKMAKKIQDIESRLECINITRTKEGEQ